jgi:hypothetical protein
MRPYLEKTHHKKRTGGVAQDVGPEFKPQYSKKKKKTKNQKPKTKKTPYCYLSNTELALWFSEEYSTHSGG